MRPVVTLFTLMALMLVAGSASAQLTPLEELGKAIFFDKISSPDNMSCAACHAPEVGFTGPIPGVNRHGAVYAGAIRQRFGNRKPPSAAYATLAPNFQYDASEELFVGGNFWDGRATGDGLGNPAADQALGPFLNPVEQNNADETFVLEQIATSDYAPLWAMAWGEPLQYDTKAAITLSYNRVGLAIAAYEASSEVNAFTSKFDRWLAGEAELTEKEMWGMELFNGKAMCSACHPAPLFTDFTYDNLGTPKNPQNPFYEMDQVFLDDGSPINPMGADWIDPGLGGFLQTLPESYFTGLGLNKADVVAENWGKHKVPTLRNVDKRPSENFPKAYLHNGVFTSLKQVVDFYNTRDVASWPPPEVAENVNSDELGDLGLNKKEVNAIVAFLGTLSDGWKPSGKGRGKASVAAAPRPQLRVLGPNPFNPATELAYTMPAPGHARLTVFDMRGRHVATLVNGWQSSGEHNLMWKPQQLPSGHYMLRFDAQGLVSQRKVTLLK